MTLIVIIITAIVGGLSIAWCVRYIKQTIRLEYKSAIKREKQYKQICKFNPSVDSEEFKVKITYISKEEADKLQSKGYWYPLPEL